MGISLEGSTLKVTDEDHQDLYDLYCEEDESEPWGKFTLVKVQPAGEWDHGVVSFLVVEVEGHEGLWGTKVQDQTGDERISWLDPRHLRSGAKLWPVDAVPSVTYHFRKIEAGTFRGIGQTLR